MRIVIGLFAAAAVAFGAAPARAENFFQQLDGYLGIGFAKPFFTTEAVETETGEVIFESQPAPGGSLSAVVGFYYPVAERWDVGLSLGYHLLGSTNVERGSLSASVDYSALDLMAMAHWQPEGLGPVARIATGAGLFHAGGQLSVAGGGGLSFIDLARDENVLGLGADVTFMRKRPAPVRIGLELGTRVGFVPQETWTLVTGRVVFHY
jgi:hypothetical protein